MIHVLVVSGHDVSDVKEWESSWNCEDPRGGRVQAQISQGTWRRLNFQVGARKIRHHFKTVATGEGGVCMLPEITELRVNMELYVC